MCGCADSACENRFFNRSIPSTENTAPCQVDDHLVLGNYVRPEMRMCGIPFNDGNGAGQHRLFLAWGDNHADLIPPLQQGGNENASDESASPGYENVHLFPPGMTGAA
jgi:hypothetical protein